MARRKHIDDILQDWDFEPNAVSVRVVAGSDQRQLLQMRIDMGVLQIEISDRPDGSHPHGFPTYLDYVLDLATQHGDGFELDEEQCNEIDREFVQYYHRRICWLQLRRFDMALLDADHTLALMDACKAFSPDEQWTLAHEQYRPFVMFHRTQAAALAELESDQQPEEAIARINEGLEQLKEVFREYEAEEQFEDDELVTRLIEMREDLRERFHLGKTLQEKLADAIASEQYELAAQLRDELRRRRPMEH